VVFLWQCERVPGELTALAAGLNNVETAMRKEIDELSTMPVGQLRQKYLEVFGEESRSNHKQFMFRRIAWRIQAIAEGGLSERARRRALEIANDADLRVRAPKPKFGSDASLDPMLSVSRKVASALDPRRPPPGTYLERDYKGRPIIVKVLVNGFEFDGEIYRSLTISLSVQPSALRLLISRSRTPRRRAIGALRLPAPLRVFGRETMSDIGSASQDDLDSIRKLIAQPGLQYIASPPRLKRSI